MVTVVECDGKARNWELTLFVIPTEVKESSTERSGGIHFLQMNVFLETHTHF